jgi:hypothetical protein
MTVLNRDEFRMTLTEEVRKAWATLRAAHPGERFYSFGIYTAPRAEYLMVTASTEEGLARATAECVRKYGGDPALRAVSLRWSPCDSPLHSEGELLPQSTALRDAGPDPYEDSPEADGAVALVFELAVEALAELDRLQVFGPEAERSDLVLGIWAGDQTDEDRIAFVRALNAPVLAERFARELEEGSRAFFALS